MKAKFIVDFRGVETSEQYYKAGETGKINSDYFDDLVNRGIVEGKKQEIKTEQHVKRTRKK